MIGIYKITNQLNNKSYIGQSIHCGKRLDEHCKGNQLIDEIIQLEGVENFTFEILKTVEKDLLSYWEDYYIMKYNTIFPNGYNKRWNCDEEKRKLIKKELQKSIGNNNKNAKDNIEILSVLKRTDTLYYWLLIHSENNCIKINDFNMSKIAKIINCNRITVSKRFNFLIDNKIISKEQDKIVLEKPLNNFIKNDIFLTNEEVFSVYHYIYYNNILNTSYTDIINHLGYSLGNKQTYTKVKNIMQILKDNNLIDFTTKSSTTKYFPYTIIDIKLITN